MGSENALLLLINLKINVSILVLSYNFDIFLIVELECAIFKVLLGLKKRRDWSNVKAHCVEISLNRSTRLTVRVDVISRVITFYYFGKSIASNEGNLRHIWTYPL